jgi:hypothetical protein
VNSGKATVKTTGTGMVMTEKVKEPEMATVTVTALATVTELATATALATALAMESVESVE